MSEQIDNYKVLSELGIGGMGVVYRGLDLLLGRQVAIKRLRADLAANPVVMERFQKEARLQAKLNHLNIAKLYALVQDGDALCIVMEFVDGTDLSHKLPMPWQTTLPVALQILEGLEYAHCHGVLHCDVKPANIMIDNEGAVKVMDFGIAYALGAAGLGKGRRTLGTIEYMAPERILGREVDQRSDIYSVGVLLFEVLSGRLPFEGQSEFEMLRKHVELDPPPLNQFTATGVPEFVEVVIRKALAKDPGQRYSACAEMAATIREHWSRVAPESPR
jgi:eukaryotic-like serine/threonine-protein kinase